MDLVSDTTLDGRLRAWRRHLHRHPETAFTENATADYLASALDKLGYDVTRGSSARAVGRRTDMDGLPIQEVEGREHGSLNAGVMHACGHDGHMPMVLGAAAVLAEEGGFDGTVPLVLQPAEEPGRGAQAMLDDGLLERFPLAVLYGLHNLPGIPAGHLHMRPGGIMASEDNFTIIIHGLGGHAARPERSSTRSWPEPSSSWPCRRSSPSKCAMSPLPPMPMAR